MFLGIFIEALPFLLLGVLASAAIHLFVRAEWVHRLSPRSPLLGALTGAVLALAGLPALLVFGAGVAINLWVA